MATKNLNGKSRSELAREMFLTDNAIHPKVVAEKLGLCESAAYNLRKELGIPVLEPYKRTAPSKTGECRRLFRANPQMSTKDAMGETGATRSTVCAARRAVYKEMALGKRGGLNLAAAKEDMRVIKKMGIARARQIIELLEAIED